MSDDERSDGPRETVQLDSHEIEELEGLPEFPDREEFVQTLEMDSATRDSMTRPTHPIPDQTTQRFDVPDQLLEMASRSQELETHEEWAEFVAVVDKKGRISLPSSVHRDLRGKKIRVRFKYETE